MKKVLSIMLVLCVAASLFAVGSVRVGAAFDFVSGKTPDFKRNETVLNNSARQYKTSGIGFDVSAKYDLSSDLSVFADFNMTFNFDFKVKRATSEDWYSFKDKSDKTLNSLSVAAGVAYKLPLANAPVKVSVGGGLFFERVLAKEKYISFNFRHIGLTAYADVTYMINDKIGVGVTAMPRIGLFDIDDGTEALVPVKSTGFAFSFGMPVSVGASYSF